MSLNANFHLGRTSAILGIVLVTLPLAMPLTWGEQSDLGDLEMYKITWKGPLPATENFNEENVIRISTHNKERYQCVVPDSVDQLNFDTSAKNSSTNEDDKTPYQILEPLMNSNYCSYRSEPYWIYELCHGRSLRQYHEENIKFKSKVTQEYYLGKIEPEQIKSHGEEYEKEMQALQRVGQNRPTVTVNGHQKPYVLFNMTGGTKCDLTKQSRVARIIYVCNDEPKHELYSVKEVSTCEYEAIVLSPLLCQHKDFKIDTITQQEIKCFSLDGSPKRPVKSIDAEEEELRNANRRQGFAYFNGRTLIIDTDLFDHQLD